METKKTSLTGTVIATAILGAASLNANTSTLFNYSALGSGAQVRSVLMNSAPSAVKMLDLTCGEKKDAKSTDTKAKDAKCGDKKAKDASCGEKKAKEGDKKAKDAKCGEGKCGDKKAKSAEPK